MIFEKNSEWENFSTCTELARVMLSNGLEQTPLIEGGCPNSRREGGADYLSSFFFCISPQLIGHGSSTLMRQSLLNPLIQMSVSLEKASVTHPKLMCGQLSHREQKSTTDAWLMHCFMFFFLFCFVQCIVNILKCLV